MLHLDDENVSKELGISVEQLQQRREDILNLFRKGMEEAKINQDYIPKTYLELIDLLRVLGVKI